MDGSFDEMYAAIDQESNNTGIDTQLSNQFLPSSAFANQGDYADYLVNRDSNVDTRTVTQIKSNEARSDSVKRSLVESGNLAISNRDANTNALEAINLQQTGSTTGREQSSTFGPLNFSDFSLKKTIDEIGNAFSAYSTPAKIIAVIVVGLTVGFVVNSVRKV